MAVPVLCPECGHRYLLPTAGVASQSACCAECHKQFLIVVHADDPVRIETKRLVLSPGHPDPPSAPHDSRTGKSGHGETVGKSESQITGES